MTYQKVFITYNLTAINFLDLLNLHRRKFKMTEGTKTARPGLVTFAAIMMFVLGGFSVVWAIEEFGNAAWLNNAELGLFSKVLFYWAITDLVIAAVAILSGFDIWRGGNVGRWVGIIIAVFSAVRAFFLLPWTPIAALLVILIDGLIIYGLSTHAEYFDQAE
jgi:hypothetical protein